MIASAFPGVPSAAALAAGLVFALMTGGVFPAFSKKASRILLQAAVVGIGFGMNFNSAIRSGGAGMAMTVVSVVFVMIAGWVLGRMMRVDSQLLTSSDESADEPADNRRAERHPSVVVSAVMMVNLMMFMVVRRRTMMSFGRVMFRRRRTLHRLMPWSGFGRSTFTAAGSRHQRSAESCTGKDENHKFFECLVHITPSLSFFGFMRPFLAAYKKVGVVSFVF